MGKRESLLANSARFGAGFVCWACGRSIANAVVKRRNENGRAGYGVYHARCKPSRDDLAEKGERDGE